MPSIYEKNLERLKQRYPDYAAMVQRASISFAPQIDSNQVRTWLQKTVDVQKRQALLLGAAGGRAVRILHDEFPLHLLVVVEQNIQHLAAAMREVDLSDVFDDECVHWIVGCPPPRLDEGLACVKSALAANGFQVIRTPVADPSAKAYYDGVLKELPGVMEREAFSLKALMARGTGVQVNLARNFPTVLESFYPDSIINTFQKKPAIVVAAGPSLDKNVERLVELNDRAVLLCVDTAAKTLLPLGIKPHFIVTSDPTPENARHFDSVDIPDETVFAYAPDCCPEVVERYREAPRKLCLLDESNWYNERLRQLLNLKMLLPRPMHVGEAAVRLAIAMGCDPIVFVGLDLAISRDAKATHAAASARALPILSKGPTGIAVRGEAGEAKTQDLIPVPGIDGEPVLTYHSFKMYLDDLALIVSETPVRWIDATEGGALKLGCTLQSLEETLGQLRERLDVERCIQAMTAPGQETVAGCVAQMQEAFERLKELSLGLQRVSKGEAEYDEAAGLWDAFLNDKEIRAFIDHAAYPFQLLPRINKHQMEERMEFLGVHSGKAANAINTLTVFWNDAFQRCGRKENQS